MNSIIWEFSILLNLTLATLVIFKTSEEFSFTNVLGMIVVSVFGPVTLIFTMILAIVVCTRGVKNPWKTIFQKSPTKRKIK